MPPEEGPGNLVVAEGAGPVAGAKVTLDCVWPEIGESRRLADLRTDEKGRFVLPGELNLESEGRIVPGDELPQELHPPRERLRHAIELRPRESKRGLDVLVDEQSIGRTRGFIVTPSPAATGIAPMRRRHA